MLNKNVNYNKNDHILLGETPFFHDLLHDCRPHLMAAVDGHNSL